MPRLMPILLWSILLSISCKLGTFFRIVEFQWFFMLLSVRPAKYLEISAHLLPWHECSKNKIHSSSWLHYPLLIVGSRWLNHLSRHCLPCLSGTYLAILVQFLGPNSSTSLLISSSSASVHGRFKVFILDPSDCASLSGRLSTLEICSTPKGIMVQLSVMYIKGNYNN